MTTSVTQSNNHGHSKEKRLELLLGTLTNALAIGGCIGIVITFATIFDPTMTRTDNAIFWRLMMLGVFNMFIIPALCHSYYYKDTNERSFDDRSWAGLFATLATTFFILALFFLK